MLRDLMRNCSDITIVAIVHISRQRRPSRLHCRHLAFMALVNALHVYLRLLATAQIVSEKAPKALDGIMFFTAIEGGSRLSV